MELELTHGDPLKLLTAFAIIPFRFSAADKKGG